MSVFSFSKADVVRGVRRDLTVDMIEWWIEHAGPKPYLMEISESYDHGINHGNLEEVAPQDKAELRQMVQLMLETGYEDRFGAGSELALEFRAKLIEFERLLNADLESTPFHERRDTSKS